VTRRRLVFSTAAVAVALAAGLVAQQPADEGSRRDAVRFYRNGQDLMSSERFERAAEEFTKAVKKDPLFTLAYYNLGRAYMNLQRYVSAVQAFQNSLASARRLYQLRETRALEIERQREDDIREMKDSISRMQAQLGPMSLRVMQAQRHLEQVEKQRPPLGAPFTPPAEVLLSLGSALFKSGNSAAAETEWKAAIDANPGLGEAHNNLAVVYMQTGRYTDAEEALKAAEKNGVRVNPQFKDDLRKARDER
jgi:tetratricopeptide (TPR) repeat protein